MQDERLANDARNAGVTQQHFQNEKVRPEEEVIWRQRRLQFINEIKNPSSPVIYLHDG